MGMTGYRNFRSKRWLALSLLPLLVGSLVFAQSTGCPGIQQQQLSNGVTALGTAPKAAINVQVVNGPQGTFTADQVAAIQTAAQGYSTNAEATVVSTPSTSSATANTPVNIVVIATQATIDALGGCDGKGACSTINKADSKGYTIISTTYIRADQVNSSLLEQLMTHEDDHVDGGVKDCSECSNTAANPDVTSSSPTAPTDCDNAQRKKCDACEKKKAKK